LRGAGPRNTLAGTGEKPERNSRGDGALLYFIYRQDKPGSLDLRMQTRPAHMEYAEEVGDKLFFAGPAMDDDGNMCASVWIVDAESREEAEEIALGDPYEKVGLFETRIIRRFMKTGGEGPDRK
jgi:uncharacterized protein YciI